MVKGIKLTLRNTMYIYIILFIFSITCGFFNLSKLREEKYIRIIILSNLYLLAIIILQSIVAYKWNLSIVGQQDFIFYVLFLSTGIVLFLIVQKMKSKWLLKIYSGLIFFSTPIFLIALLLAGRPLETRFISKNIEIRQIKPILGGSVFLIIVRENFLLERAIKIKEKNFDTKSIKDSSISDNESKLIFKAVDTMAE